MLKVSQVKLLLALFLFVPFCFIAPVHGSQPQENPSDTPIPDAKTIRELIIARVGGVDKLRVPARNEDLPQPTLADGSIDPRYKITEAKRYLGKQLFFDPVRMNRFRPEFGGDFSTMQTASCGSCHLGEVAGKAGQIVNLAQGAEGRGYTDVNGVFHVRRRLQPGKVDIIPTGLDLKINGVVVKDGRFDMVDSVPRLSPSMIGFGFNNRLLLGGKVGQPAGDPNNPHNLPAGENLAETAFDSHRMLETQKNALQTVPVYIKLFQDAFPEEASKYAASGKLDDLINDDTVERAVATFLRTVVTRNTPWDKFLAGDDKALTPHQRQGAKLFLTRVSDGGANCISCHSGPMLNKQLGDEDGKLVEENFYNLGVGDHPLRDLARQALGDPNHHDLGRGEITGRAEDNFKFRVLTLRQLKDAGGQLTHSAGFKTVREMVEYFNKGIPQDSFAIAAGNVTSRFTHPRGADAPAGLGLNQVDVLALVDFLENGLYDTDFARFNPNSSTDSFELNERDLKYSAYRPNLTMLGAVDGLMASGLCSVSNDALTRRDFGLEFLDVTSRISVGFQRMLYQFGDDQTYRLKLTNISNEPIDTHLLLFFKGLPYGASVLSGEGRASKGEIAGLPYQRVFLPDGVIEPEKSVEVIVKVFVPRQQPLKLNLTILSGQGKP